MATERYDAPAREKHWQAAWEEAQIFRAAQDDGRPRCYVLEMFPYPSGRIHMGHVRNYTMGDVFARYKRAKGFNVLHPMGWDAFGMPAENAAMERKVHPAKWTHANIETMKAQLKSMGLSLDWSRELATCEPDYYAHQQCLFLDFLDKGLAYRRLGKVNWDPVDQTVLANEQVVDGRGWRSGALVEQRERMQWCFRITAYAEELLAALGTLDKWPEKVRLMQANWIGRSEGLLVRWALYAKAAPQGFGELEVYTTRPDTLFGAAFLAIAPMIPSPRPRPRRIPRSPPSRRMPAHGHPLADLETAEKKGYDTGIRAHHPFDKDWHLPVYVANFVLMEYGTGAIFGCPSGDQRDFEFAPVRAGVRAGDPTARRRPRHLRARGRGLRGPRHDDQPRISSTGSIPRPRSRRSRAASRRQRSPASPSRSARSTTACATGASRASATGGPIPVIHCGDCGVVPVPRADLPVELPEDASFDQPGNPPRPAPDLEAREVPGLRQASDARNGHDGHVRRQLLVFRALHRAARQGAGRCRSGRRLAARRPVHRRHRARDPAPALRALLHARSPTPATSTRA